ncbi:PREDICTED: CBL-interacting serine/threonine-protein kinase 15 isoform X2 [Camelina sativa]|uniref:non-specific serine/threonine protein kinase n=1 Tax=Camelina sativa TaxID=90675 RepID=A0ABM1RFP3_CAMSA|nr:PREDICTED: CBL-interacting serine/threonine-protein kinase 15 isoform X2 [Camelina sativa]
MEKKGSVLMLRYEVGKFLGQGTFAKVYHARHLKSGDSVAIKVIDKERILKVGMTEQIKREISVMRLLRHPNIVELHEVMATKSKIYFVMDHVKGGELFNKVSAGKLSEDVARNYFQQLVRAVDYCHSRGVCHRDLKPENLLLDEDGSLKVSDFGLSALSDSRRQDGLLHTTCGTPAYVAPEVISRRGYDGFKADVWSCGVILYVLLAGYLPFRDSNLMELYKKIGKAEVKFPNWFAPGAKRLLKRILDPNPNTRVSTEKIMKSSWFRKGLQQEQKKGSVDEEDVDVDIDVDAEANANANASADKEKKRCINLNAFEIISLSTGFDLSGLFEEGEEKEEMRFTTNKEASEITEKLVEIGKELKMKVRTKEQGWKVKMAAEAAVVEAEVFEIAPSFHMVVLKKSDGDTAEYKRVMKESIRPALIDIALAWH